MQAETEPYTHNNKKYVRVKLVERIGEPKISREYKADVGLQKRYKLLCRILQEQNNGGSSSSSPSSSSVKKNGESTDTKQPSYVSETMFSALMDDE